MAIKSNKMYKNIRKNKYKILVFIALLALIIGLSVHFSKNKGGNKIKKPTCSEKSCQEISKPETDEIERLELILTNDPTKENCKNSVMGMKNYLETICKKDECKCLPEMAELCKDIETSILNLNDVCDLLM